MAVWKHQKDKTILKQLGQYFRLHGSVDPVSGMEDVTNLVDELNDFEIQHEVHIYGGVRHSFNIKGSRDFS